MMALLGAITVAEVKTNVAIGDFEATDYGAWAVTGNAFGSGPAKGALPGQNPVAGYEGGGLANSFTDGDNSKGTLTSPEFVIERAYIDFLIGGGHRPDEACAKLIVGGKVVRTATGKNDEMLEWMNWDVKDLAGKTAQIQIVDNATGPWGHVNVDQICQSERKKGTAVVPAQPLEGILIADFEGSEYSFEVTGEAFGKRPAGGTLPGQMLVTGYLGHGLANSFVGGDDSVGILISPEIVVEKPYINFLVGGGQRPDACINLLSGGKVVRTATGKDEERLQ